VALLLAGRALEPEWGLALVAGVMALGGVVNARRVGETLSKKITRMSPGQGFTANLVTSLLAPAAWACRCPRPTSPSAPCSASA
jgi:PiT family inorganic phosphate transporter